MSARQRFAGVLVLVVVVAVGLLLSPAAGQRKAPERRKQLGIHPPAAVLVPGQASTLLGDGRSLMTGGVGASGALKQAALRNPDSNASTPLPNDLQVGRAWHTATVLPDGTVLILGGLDAKGLIATEELFDPARQNFQTIATDIAPRAYHTATLLTDGRVLVAGGVSGDGRLSTELELWDFRKRAAEKLDARLATGRRNHAARLLADGKVLLWGGLSESGAELQNGELYDPETQMLAPLEAAPAIAEDGVPQLEASLPADGSTEVPVDRFIALRFSKPLRVSTVNALTATLRAGDRPVVVKVVPAEAGMLAFLTPDPPLAPATTYTLRMDGLTDAKHQPLPAAEVSFTTVADRLVQPEKGSHPVAAAPDRGTTDPDPLPPLQAPPGVTALSGRVLLSQTAKPLPNVTLEIDCAGQKGSAMSDGTGRFLIAPIGDGRCKFEIDGGSGNRPGKSYGVFFVGLDIVKGRTNVLPYYIWMTELDIPHAVKIPSPTASEFVVTTPLLRGLELRLPPGATVRDYDGNVITQISITPIPLARPPFPLPRGVAVPFYFTIQPGGAYIEVPKDSPGPKGARLIYPNVGRAPAGARFNFWNYDYKEKGWYVYGLGTVTPDRRSVEPDPGVVLYEFTGAMVAGPGLAPPFGPAPTSPSPCSGGPPGGAPSGGAPSGGEPSEPTSGDPVDLGTGLFLHFQTDLSLPDVIPIRLTRTYRQGDAQSRAFGIGTTHTYEMFLVGDTFPYTYADLILPDGGRIHFQRISPGTSYGGAVYEHTSTPTAFYKAQITWNGTGWNLRMKDGTLYLFPDGFLTNLPAKAALLKIQDRNGNVLNLTRDGTSGNLTRITSPNGRWIDFTYDAASRVTQAKDNAGRTLTYAYDEGGRLITVTDPLGGIKRYTYDANNEMLTYQDTRGIVVVNNDYDLAGRVVRQTLADGSTYQFAYTLDASGNNTQTDVTDPRGIVRRAVFGSTGYYSASYIISNTYALARPEQQTITYERQSGTNVLLSLVDALGRRTAYTYDALGNVTSVTGMAGTTEATTSTYSYEPSFNQLTSATDPLNHTVIYAYDAKGNLTAVTDPLGNQSTITYNAAGQPISITDPLGNRSSFAYQAGDLISTTNPLGQTNTRIADAIGRTVSASNPLGHVYRYYYDALDHLLRLIDPAAGVNTFSYDAVGNILALTDARGSVTTYSYDDRDRQLRRTDPLQRVETYQYDAGSNLTRLTDRKGQVINSTFDAFSRLTQVTYADGSTTSYTYDSAHRLTQSLDSVAGTITRSYDNLNRVIAETTPQGSVSYTYDAAGRRASMTVAGQPGVAYSYDTSDRLTQISQGSATVVLTHDAAGRRTSLTLPSGVRVEYGYNAVSQLTSIVYKLGSTTLGNLIYEYDAAGRRIRVGGSYARTALPQGLRSATYDAANQVAQRDGTALTYDANGSLTSDGTNTNTWNARDQLAAVAGPGLTATFQYDAFGRRTSRTVNGVSTGFLYDGLNLVQELSGGAPSANILAGLNLDEVFARTDSSGMRSLVADGLGSTVALFDSGGTAQTEYTYEPFGKTTFTGSASSNSCQYTGRENDGTGLYYHRARYYQPSLQRFISEDPIGFLGGDTNLHSYVFNSPSVYTDPLGLQVPFLPGWIPPAWAPSLCGRVPPGVPPRSVPNAPGPQGPSGSPWPRVTPRPQPQSPPWPTQPPPPLNPVGDALDKWFKEPESPATPGPGQPGFGDGGGGTVPPQPSPGKTRPPSCYTRGGCGPVWS